MELAKIKHEPPVEFVLILPPATDDGPAPLQQSAKDGVKPKPGLSKMLTNVFKCEKCPYQAKAESFLAKHKRAHLEGTFDCEKCEKSFLSPYSLQHHQKGVHDEKQVTCKVCGKVFKNRNSLYQHNRTHDKAECSICNKMVAKFLMAALLRAHTAKKIFKCDLCDYSSRLKSYLKLHIERSHLLPKLQNDYKYREDFYEFALLEELQLRHGRSATSGDTKFKCDKCNKSFVAPNSLNQHKREVHTKFKTSKVNIKLPKRTVNVEYGKVLANARQVPETQETLIDSHNVVEISTDEHMQPHLPNALADNNPEEPMSRPKSSNRSFWQFFEEQVDKFSPHLQLKFQRKMTTFFGDFLKEHDE